MSAYTTLGFWPLGNMDESLGTSGLLDRAPLDGRLGDARGGFLGRSLGGLALELLAHARNGTTGGLRGANLVHRSAHVAPTLVLDLFDHDEGVLWLLVEDALEHLRGL